MNDFTKDELKEMSLNLSWCIDAFGHSEFQSDLYNKLQSMIDNYCERKPNSKSYSGSQEDNTISECLWNMRCSDQFIQLIRKIITRELGWMKSYGNQ